jgi:hypothetical protein
MAPPHGRRQCGECRRHPQCEGRDVQVTEPGWHHKLPARLPRGVVAPRLCGRKIAMDHRPDRKWPGNQAIARRGHAKLESPVPRCRPERRPRLLPHSRRQDRVRLCGNQLRTARTVERTVLTPKKFIRSHGLGVGCHNAQPPSGLWTMPAQRVACWPVVDAAGQQEDVAVRRQRCAPMSD